MTKPAIEIIDLHSHLIPAIDDGPRLLEETVQTLRIGYENGVRSVVATPHMFLDPYDLREPEHVRDRFEQMSNALDRVSGDSEYTFLKDMTIHLGSENYASKPFLEALALGAVLTLSGSRYLLVEFSPFLSLKQIRNVVERIQDQELVPVLAHIERYPALRNKTDELHQLLEQGCLTQVNLGSLLRPLWSKGGRLARRLVSNDVVSIIASDSHGPLFRPPNFGELMKRHSERLGRERLVRLCSSNPAWILRRGVTKVDSDHSTSNKS